MLQAPLHKIIPFSSVDGPGNRVAIFFQGCGFNCKYCHNPETISLCTHCGLCVNTCPVGALSQDPAGQVVWDSAKCIHCQTCENTCPHDASPLITWVTPEMLFAQIEPYLPFVSGVTLSGGECTLHHQFIAAFFPLVQQRGKTTFLDSNGQLDMEALAHLMAVTDKVMLDVKATDPMAHQALTGQSCDMVMKNLHYLIAQQKLFEIRTVVVPGLLDNGKTVKTAAAIIAQDSAIRYKLIAYRQNGVRPHCLENPSPTGQEMEALAQLAHQQGVTDVVII